MLDKYDIFLTLITGGWWVFAINKKSKKLKMALVDLYEQIKDGFNVIADAAIEAGEKAIREGTCDDVEQMKANVEEVKLYKEKFNREAKEY